ncbi:MAG: YbaN family protein [Actinomycetota bacterium]|nr:YbaN family protein [Actinomycetota bacterium]
MTRLRKSTFSSAKSFFVKSLLLLLGLIFVGLGFIGIIVPGMPTTVFMILAAACFAKSSPKFEQWILDLPGIGRLVQDHRNGLGMPQKSKAIAITMMVLAVTLSIIFAITSTLVQILVGGVGIIGVWYVGVQVPTKEKVLALRDTEQNY